MPISCPELAEIKKKAWNVRIQIHLRPKLNYGVHCTDFDKIQSDSAAIYKGTSSI
jgi:hypothetical protein